MIERNVREWCRVIGCSSAILVPRPPVGTDESKPKAGAQLSENRRFSVDELQEMSSYEECRLLGYKNPVRTSQETHYFSTTESSQLMLCKI
jgi:hypothetical protein